ncbi:MAG: hypothetical protein M5R36_16390 [Deltaproteobacteria bacterium]|nr:hypothetical protein [Deltaproteobacteria bacterium]
MIDRAAGTATDRAGKTRRLKGTPGDVLQFWFDAGGKNRLTVRPSGTEPKVKHYAAVYEPVTAPQKLDAAKKTGRRAGDGAHQGR